MKFEMTKVLTSDKSYPLFTMDDEESKNYTGRPVVSLQMRADAVDYLIGLQKELESVLDWLWTDLEALDPEGSEPESGLVTIHLDTLRARLDSVKKALE